MTAPESLTLAGEFPDPTRERWRELVADVLRKAGREVDPADVEDVLATPTDDGFSIRPLYAAEDSPGLPGVPGLPPFVRGATPQGPVAGGWSVRQRHTFAPGIAPQDARDVLMAELENGVGSLWLVLGERGGPPVDAVEPMLESVFLDLAPVVLDAGRDAPAAAGTLLRLAGEAGSGAVAGQLGFDPLLARTRGGEPLAAAYLEAMRTLSARAAAEHPALRTVVADGLPFHEAGGSDGEELGAALAAGVAALRRLTAESGPGPGMAVDEAFARIEFRLAATADQFVTLAKLRAARRCWDRVGEVCGAEPAARGMHQHAVTSPAMMTVRDPWVNMLRTTVAAVGAGLGGAAAVTVLPFDTALGLPDDFSRRIARNTQALLLEESGLADVADPAGGSWYVESLTESLAAAAWAFFTEIERAGGIEAALDDGTVGERLAATWAGRVERIAHRRDAITGVSEFPNLAEELPERTPAPAPAAEGGLPRLRYAQPFEDLRARADAAAEAGARPTVFLATIGTLAQYTARASFATNLFHAGGIATVEGPGGTDPDDIARAFADSGARVAVLASSGRIYAEHAAGVADALRARGAERVLLAGPPSTEGPSSSGSGAEGDGTVDGHLYAGCDAAGVIADTLEALEVDR